jgi:hypothetical protein
MLARMLGAVARESFEPQLLHGLRSVRSIPPRRRGRKRISLLRVDTVKKDGFLGLSCSLTYTSTNSPESSTGGCGQGLGGNQFHH